MKIFVMEGCPGCGAVKTKIEELNKEDKFTFIDVHDNYDGYMPEQVPVLQDSTVGTIQGEEIINFLTKVYE